MRAVGPRESFGEDDLYDAASRQQTAKAAGVAGGGAGTSGSSRHATRNDPSIAGGPGSVTSRRATRTMASVMSVINPNAVAAASGSSTVAGAAGSSSTQASRLTVDSSLVSSRTTAAGMGSSNVGDTVLLALSSNDYLSILKGGHSRLLEEKVQFLSSLPALKRLSADYLQGLAHCFHQWVRERVMLSCLWCCGQLFARGIISAMLFDQSPHCINTNDVATMHTSIPSHRTLLMNWYPFAHAGGQKFVQPQDAVITLELLGNQH